MNDQFYEQIIKKKNGAKEIAIYIAIGISLLLLSIYGFLVLGVMIIPFVLLAVFLVYRFILIRLKVEYEYSIVNYDLQIDAIYNKEKRKEVMSINLREANMVALSDSESIKRIKVDKVKNYTSGTSKSGVISIIVNSGSKKYNIMIEPDEIMTKHIKEWSGSAYLK